MKPGRAERLRDLWLPALVGLASMLASLGVWGLLVADRRDQVLATARDTAVETRDAVQVALEQQLETLEGLRELWSTFGLRPIAEWEANVGHRVDRVAGLSSVTWVDLDEPRNRTAVGSLRSAHSIELDAEAARQHYGAPHLEGPEPSESGSAGYRVFLPVQTREDHAGVLVGRFVVAPFLEQVLYARARGYAISVLWNGEEIYSRGSPSTDRWQTWWRAEEEVVLPMGGRWRIVQRPTPEFAAARLTPTPHYLLAAGIMLSGVLAVVAYQLRVIARQARFLKASNRALERRGDELEARVAERTAALEDAIAELEAFNYSVSHDLRSPLGAILNFAMILEEDYRDRALGDEGVAILGRISRSATRATALLEDLLQLSRAGRAALSFESVDMAALARETFAQVQAAADDRDIELQIEPLPEAICDRILVGNVFANLFSNALKYSRGREKRCVVVRGRVSDGECIYEVADNGHGFDMRFEDKLFRLFERLHNNDEIEGTGVGLALVARVVKRHGGRVWAKGVPHEGACIGFSLPTRESS